MYPNSNSDYQASVTEWRGLPRSRGGSWCWKTRVTSRNGGLGCSGYRSLHPIHQCLLCRGVCADPTCQLYYPGPSFAYYSRQLHLQLSTTYPVDYYCEARTTCRALIVIAYYAIYKRGSPSQRTTSVASSKKLDKCVGAATRSGQKPNE
jgi:hypothetical protein